MLRNRKGTIAILEALQPIVMAFAIFMIIYLFLFQPHRVDGNSMFPNFHDKELLLTDKITYRHKLPQRGQVIVFHAPPPFEDDFIKRIVGLPGEVIMIKEHAVYINNQRLNEYYLPDTILSEQKSFLREGMPYTIPEGYYMVFGDNRNFSSDSREWGPININSIVGKVWIRYWPPDKLGIIESGKAD